MGNTATSSSGSRRDRTSSVDSRDSHSPRNDEPKSFEFSANRRKPLLSYQSSVEYASGDDNDECKGRPRSKTVSHGTSSEKETLPTVFKWEGGGKDVYIKGTFSEWKPVKMSTSHGDFVAIVDVPEGVHEYKFIVDGNEKVNKNAKIDEITNNNVIQVRKGDFEVMEALAMDIASNNSSTPSLNGSPPGSYSQILPSQYGSRQRSESGGHAISYPSSTVQHHHRHNSSGNNPAGPPILPPHLLQVILNNPTVNTGEPTLLPPPNHVMLNHLYALSIKDGVMVLSCTHRYRKKYVTTLLYKPI